MWLRLWHRRQKQFKRTLRNSPIRQWLGQGLFHRVLWTLDKKPVAGGLALGLFIAFTPTIPFQMALAAVGALYFRVNLPIALAACWVTNPLTAIPVYLAARQLGKQVVLQMAWLDSGLDWFWLGAKSAWLFRQTAYLWLGSLMFSIVAALAAHVLVHGSWFLIRRFSYRKRRLAPSADLSN